MQQEGGLRQIWRRTAAPRELSVALWMVKDDGSRDRSESGSTKGKTSSPQRGENVTPTTTSRRSSNIHTSNLTAGIIASNRSNDTLSTRPANQTLPKPSALAPAEKTAVKKVRGMKAEDGVAAQPVVSGRRTGKRKFGARVPKEFSKPFRGLEETIAKGQQPPLLAFRLLLKKVSRSATIGYEWPDMQRGREIFRVLNQAGMEPDTDCFRFYIVLAAKRAWKGEVSRQELWGILSSARSFICVTGIIHMRDMTHSNVRVEGHSNV